MSNREWSEDHSFLQDLCKKAGYSDIAVYGDSYGVPSIQDLADMLFDKIQYDSRLTGLEWLTDATGKEAVMVVEYPTRGFKFMGQTIDIGIVPSDKFYDTRVSVFVNRKHYTTLRFPK